MSNNQRRKAPATTPPPKKSPTKPLMDVGESKQVITQLREKLTNNILSNADMARKAAHILSDWIKNKK